MIGMWIHLADDLVGAKVAFFNLCYRQLGCEGRHVPTRMGSGSKRRIFSVVVR